MANFTGQTVTNAGRNLLGRVLAGEGKLVFTKAAFGDQKHSDDLRAVRDLKHKKLDLKVMNIRNDSGTAVLTVYMSNENVEEGFRTEEFGVYAKIDTDDEEILYSYCVAIEADFFPNNRLGHTYENVTDVYMAIANDVDADIHVQDGVVFLTKRIADENYIKYGVQAVGELEGRTSLEENKRYSSKGEWYLNIGGNRSWDKSPTPDENLIPMTWDWLFKNSQHLSKQEIENLLGFNVINQEFILATLDDIKNLFPGSGGTSGAFDLGHISNDSTKIVNMMLLSNYNEYLQQKILEIKGFFNNLNSGKADKTELSNYYTKQEIDSKVDTLESNKADKTALNEFYKKNVTYTKTEVDEMLNNKADSETVTTNLNDKANKTTKIIVGDGLLGTGTLESNINITVDNLSDEEIQSLMTNWR